MSKDVYNEVARAKISDTRSLVISEYANGGYTMAQLLEVEEKEGDEQQKDRRCQVAVQGHVQELVGSGARHDHLLGKPYAPEQVHGHREHGRMDEGVQIESHPFREQIYEKRGENRCHYQKVQLHLSLIFLSAYQMCVVPVHGPVTVVQHGEHLQRHGRHSGPYYYRGDHQGLGQRISWSCRVSYRRRHPRPVVYPQEEEHDADVHYPQRQYGLDNLTTRYQAVKPDYEQYDARELNCVPLHIPDLPPATRSRTGSI